MHINIEPKAKLISSLAENIRDRDWASDLLVSCRQIRDALEEIEKEARRRLPSER